MVRRTEMIANLVDAVPGEKLAEANAVVKKLIGKLPERQERFATVFRRSMGPVLGKFRDIAFRHAGRRGAFMKAPDPWAQERGILMVLMGELEGDKIDEAEKYLRGLIEAE